MGDPMPKKKVYVETTVVSDATALPARDIVQLGRQIVTREWWETAAQRFDLFSSIVVAKEVRNGDPVAAQRRVEALIGLPRVMEFQAHHQWTHDSLGGKNLP